MKMVCVAYLLPICCSFIHSAIIYLIMTSTLPKKVYLLYQEAVLSLKNQLFSRVSGLLPFRLSDDFTASLHCLPTLLHLRWCYTSRCHLQTVFANGLLVSVKRVINAHRQGWRNRCWVPQYITKNYKWVPEQTKVYGNEIGDNREMAIVRTKETIDNSLFGQDIHIGRNINKEQCDKWGIVALLGRPWEKQFRRRWDEFV